ncbi:HAD-IA family hydrolase [Thalassospira sp. MA62]|nr:HAD-IA family hydrolase [Thalassospira sp. MA62]
MIEAVIFDCDGVLIDSEILSFAVDEKLLPDYGVTITTGELARDFGGVTYGEMVAALNERFGANIETVSYQKRCEAELVRTFETELRAIEGIHDLLENLSAPFALASGSDLARLDQCLRLTNLAGFFEDRVFSAEQVKRGKPAPDVFLLAAKTCGWTPAHSLVIEDSPSGVVAAKAAGMQSVGFLGGAHRSDEDADILRDAGAVHVAGNSTELCGYLHQIGVISAI